MDIGKLVLYHFSLFSYCKKREKCLQRNLGITNAKIFHLFLKRVGVRSKEPKSKNQATDIDRLIISTIYWNDMPRVLHSNFQKIHF